MNLIAEGEQWQYLVNIDTHAQQMFNTLIEQMKEAEGVTEKLREDNQMEWVCCMQNIEAMAREIVNSEIIFN